MVAAPPIVAHYGSNIANGTAPVTGSATFNAGDWIFVIALTCDSFHRLGTPSGPPVGSPGWTSLQSIQPADFGAAYGWYAKVTSNWTGTISLPISQMGATGFRSAFFRAYRFDARSGGLGAHAGTFMAGAMALTIVTQRENSSLIWCGVDWNAQTWTPTPTFRLPSGSTAGISDGAAHTAGVANWVCGRHVDSGPAGSKVVGLTTPTTWKNTIVAIEVLGDVVAPGTVPNVLATLVSSTSATVTWDAATDNVAIASYKVYRNAVEVADIPVASPRTFTDTGLAAETLYQYTVRAIDTSGNPGAIVGWSNVTTPAQRLRLGAASTKFMLGSTPISKIYLGEDQVWP